MLYKSLRSPLKICGATHIFLTLFRILSQLLFWRRGEVDSPANGGNVATRQKGCARRIVGRTCNQNDCCKWSLVAFATRNKVEQPFRCSTLFSLGGEERIRTSDGFHHTRFPSGHIRPLWHLSVFSNYVQWVFYYIFLWLARKNTYIVKKTKKN